MSIKKILITGSNGFIGKNLISSLKEKKEYDILSYDLENSDQELVAFLNQADFIVHLAGVNRPSDDKEFTLGNADLTTKIISILKQNKKKTPILFSSSIQAEQDNPYGQSKKTAEQVIKSYSDDGGTAYIYRLSNVFGKWCRPNYNSVVATFCHNISRGLDININDGNKAIEFVYVDDVINEIIKKIENPQKQNELFFEIKPCYSVKVGELAEKIYGFKDIRQTSTIPYLTDQFTKKLYATYLSYLPENSFAYEIDHREDERGILFELLKSKAFGQIFVSTTKPGVTRGNHYHHTKVEKFCVIKGHGVIRLRHIFSDQILEYEVSEKNIKIVDIPPGYTHAITNVGGSDMITIFWAGEIFDHEHPDTFHNEVKYE